MRAQIDIDMNTPAFDEEGGGDTAELVRILRALGDDLEADGSVTRLHSRPGAAPLRLRDINGNQVGYFRLVSS
jgi:hypothetical protein